MTPGIGALLAGLFRVAPRCITCARAASLPLPTAITTGPPGRPDSGRRPGRLRARAQTMAVVT